MIFISGCSVPFFGDDISSNGFGAESKETGTKEAKKGIRLEFPENMPPSEIKKGINFGMVLKFLNYGVVEAQDLKVKIFGFEPGFVSGLDTTEYSTTKPIPKVGTNGAGSNDEIRIQNIKVDNFNSKSYDFQPTFQVCYKYKTALTENLCVPTVGSYTQTQCEPQEVIKPISNFPISITQIDNYAINENEIEFMVSVSNVGDGKPIEYDNCFSDEPFYSTPVTITKFELGTISGTCQDANSGEQGIVELKNGQGVFVCKVTRSSTMTSPYNSQLTIELDYAYQNDFNKKITIKNPSFNR